MTTNGINNISRIQQAGLQPENKKADQVKDAARKNDTVEISRKNKPTVNLDATYSKESIQQTLDQIKAADNFEAVHDLAKIKEKIANGYYDNDLVINSIANRIADDLD